MTPRRDLTYCKDTAVGFVKLAECDDAVGKEVNICNSKEISMGDLATLLIEMINPSATIQSDEDRLRPEKSEVERLLGSNAVLSELTGWVPATPLQTGLERSIAFIKENLAHYKPEIYNV
jgi:dTDP-glucose 4,6-dehydratase